MIKDYASKIDSFTKSNMLSSLNKAIPSHLVFSSYYSARQYRRTNVAPEDYKDFHIVLFDGIYWILDNRQFAIFKSELK